MGVLVIVLTIASIYIHTSLPQLNGTVQSKGLGSSVKVIRDKNAVPHIYAHNSNDAYFGLGYVHAQDRLWQLEMNRRIGSGRLAEIFGEAALDKDKFLRTLGIRPTASAIYQSLSDTERTRLEAYGAGINSFIENRQGSLPMEFLIIGVKPEPWTPEDSIAWQLMMAWDLSANWRQELLRLELSSHLSTQQIQEFLPPYPGDSALSLPNLKVLYENLANVDVSQLIAKAPSSLPEGAGSNNWVINGSRSSTGKPLLANDPHLGLSAPSLWYLAHLDSPDLKVIGATLPGIPAIVLGRNQRIAWGYTNTGPDTQDLFIEKIDRANKVNYKTPTGVQAFITYQERIKVKNGEDVIITIRNSRHGPIISDAAEDIQKLLPPNHVLAFSWTALRQDDKTIVSGDKLSRANNWQEFTEAVKDFHSPQQNILYADVDGNIGFIAPARVPIRKSDNDINGLAPSPGWDAKYDWNGFIPFDQLPQQYNPASGKIVTANEKIVPNDYPHFLTSEWVPPFRADRINQLLDKQPKHSIESFQHIQADVTSLAAIKVLKHFKNIKVQDQQTQKLIELLNAWNGEMKANRSEPLIFNVWLREFTRLLYEDELGKAFARAWDQRMVFSLNVLNNKNGESRWCDDIKTKEKETCDQLIESAFSKAKKYLQQTYGQDLTKWQWGNAHIAHSTHRPFSGKPIVGSLFDISVPSPGDTYTINVGRNSISNDKEPFANHHAASYRAIYDFADLDRSLFMQSAGQSGNRLSIYYDDLAPKWVNVEYLNMSMKQNEIESGAIGTLVLEPNNNSK